MDGSIKKGAVIILAAGLSKRLGSPKQLLVFQGDSLINRIISTARKSTDFPVLVILGANAETIKDQVKDKEAELLINTDWEEGIASSIRKGLDHAIKIIPELEGVLILLCDQPHIKEENIRSLLKIQEDSGRPIAACSYAGTIGTPALFHKSVFQELLSLEGDTGARSILKKRKSELAILFLESGAIDIDTIEDYNKLIQEDQIK